MTRLLKNGTALCLALALAPLAADRASAADTTPPPTTSAPIVEECTPTLCGPWGTCVSDDQRALCICDPGHDGLRCDTCDPYLELDREGQCVAGQLCRDALCGGNGECLPITGQIPSCDCDAGFAGIRCETCAPGFVAIDDRCVPSAESCDVTGCTTGTVSCPPGKTGPECDDDLPVAAYRMTGHDQVVELGTSTVVSAVALGVGNHDRLVWKLVAGRGTLKDLGRGKARYTAPSSSALAYDTATIKVYPACCESQGQTLGLGFKAPAMPWVTGVANPLLKSVDEALMKFMYDRCTGGLVFGLNWKGVPIYRRGYGRTAGRSTPGRPGVDCGAVNPSATPVYPDSPVRIGSTTKAVTAAMVRRAVWARLFALGRLPDLPALEDVPAYWAEVDEVIENVRLLDVDVGLVPQLLRDILGKCTWTGVNSLNPDGYACTGGFRLAPAPLTVSDTSAPSSCSNVGGPACANGGTCTANDDTFSCQCATGFTGARCLIATWGDLGVLSANGVDSRWQQMTLGHIMSHQAGLPPDVVSESTILANLFALRGAHNPTFNFLDDVGPELHELNDAFAPPGEGQDARRMLQDRPSSFEYVLAETGRNLRNPPGTIIDDYSNLGFVILGLVVETLSGSPDWAYGEVIGGSFTALSDHLGSPLDAFVSAEIGGRPGDLNPWGAKRSTFGMFMSRSPNPLDPPGSQVDLAELEPRDWVNGGWNPPMVDDKGIVCNPTDDGTICDFVQDGTLDGYGNPGLVPYGMHGTLMFTSAGALVTEADLYLRFMGKFLTGYGTLNPSYGRHRTSWSQGSRHSGLWAGARAFVRQIGWKPDGWEPMCNARKVTGIDGDLDCPPGSTCCKDNYECVNGGGVSLPVTVATQAVNICVETTNYNVPLVNAATGAYTTDPTPFGVRRCVLPEGLDIFVATNQSSDGQDSGSSYNRLIDAALAGLCQVKWPVSPLVLMPKGNNFAP